MFLLKRHSKGGCHEQNYGHGAVERGVEDHQGDAVGGCVQGEGLQSCERVHDPHKEVWVLPQALVQAGVEQMKLKPVKNWKGAIGGGKYDEEDDFFYMDPLFTSNNAKIEDNGFLKSHPRQARQFLEGTVCFAWVRSGGEYEFGVNITPKQILARYDKKEDYPFPVDPEQLVECWYRDVKKFMHPLKVLNLKGKTWACFRGKKSRAENMLMMTLLDFPQRYPNMHYAYWKLRGLLWREDPWFLFQVAHFLPSCQPVLIPKEEYKGKLAEALTLYGGGRGHVIGNDHGIFEFRDSFKSALRATANGGGVNGFFPAGNKEYPNPLWTWNEFAEWTQALLRERGVSQLGDR